jgi:D-alanine-D-alanine ligase
MQTGTKITVGLLCGGRSSEHEVSLTSAASVLREIDRDRFDVIPILITRKGEWMLVDDTEILLAYANKVQAQQNTEENYRCVGLKPVVLDYSHSKKLLAFAQDQQFSRTQEVAMLPRQLDVILPILHGPYGEDGTIQGLCEMAEIPCVGAGIIGSAAGLDKVVMKELFAHHNFPIAPYIAFRTVDWQKREQEIIAEIEAKLPYPLFVKPANCGSSVGVNKAHDRGELVEYVPCAAKFDRKIVVEQGLDVRELECAVLGNDFPEASGIGEVFPGDEFYSYPAKYGEESTTKSPAHGTKAITLRKSTTKIPADVPEAVAQRVRTLAVQAFLAVDCAGFARVDFFMEKSTDKIYVNEINTIPGFTPISMFPQLWQAAGISYRNLITKLVELAMERFKQSASKSYSVV